MNCFYCIFYVTGLFLACAYDVISYKKVATQSHTYPGMGYEASNAVDGNIETCMRTGYIGVNSLDKTMWWKVDLGGVYNIYSINILYKNYKGYDIRQRGRFAGFSLYVSNTGVIQGSTVCYKDESYLPFLNFTTMCMDSGRYVIFYNERLGGVTYPTGYEVTSVVTELCEVTVQGCNNASFYGSNCDTLCPTNCKYSTCHIQSGACFTCKLGWTGANCDSNCREGWYGINCSQQCVGHCRYGVTCNHVTGQCDRGCNTGWTGTFCNKECNNGSYGYDCVNNCSGHCLYNYPCNKQTGQCDRGCNQGYTGEYCNKKCRLGHFGTNCSERCSSHCINNEPCDHVSGVCPRGCQDGFVGTHCYKSCYEGYFGTNCSKKCSPYCKPDTCRPTDGWCTCAAGWTGYNCTTECTLTYGENCQHRCNIHCFNQTCYRFNSSCLYDCEDGEQCDDEQFRSFTSSNNIPLFGIVGVGAFILTIIGVVIAIFVIRKKSSNIKGHPSVPQFCWRSTSAAEQIATTKDASNYQELNFSLEENPYQSISR